MLELVFNRTQVQQPPPSWLRLVAFSLKYFDEKCMNCPDVHTKVHFCQPLLLKGLGWVNSLKHFFFFCQELLKYPEIIQKSQVCLPLISNRWTQLTEFFFTRNCMKYPDLHRKIIFANPTPIVAVQMGVKGSI